MDYERLNPLPEHTKERRKQLRRADEISKKLTDKNLLLIPRYNGYEAGGYAWTLYLQYSDLAVPMYDFITKERRISVNEHAEICLISYDKYILPLVKKLKEMAETCNLLFLDEPNPIIEI